MELESSAIELERSPNNWRTLINWVYQFGVPLTFEFNWTSYFKYFRKRRFCVDLPFHGFSLIKRLGQISSSCKDIVLLYWTQFDIYSPKESSYSVWELSNSIEELSNSNLEPSNLENALSVQKESAGFHLRHSVIKLYTSNSINKFCLQE